jgi:hypothetical protein
MLLPYEALRHGTRRPVLLSHILFLVMGSTRFRARSELVQQSWCQRQKASCIFVTDDAQPGEDERERRLLDTKYADPLDDSQAQTSISDRHGRNRSIRRGAGGMPLIRVRDALPPSNCFCNDSARTKSEASSGFFCRSHRAATLEAQYRFLPVRRQLGCRTPAAFRNGMQLVYFGGAANLLFGKEKGPPLRTLSHSFPQTVGFSRGTPLPHTMRRRPPTPRGIPRVGPQPRQVFGGIREQVLSVDRPRRR